MKEKKVTMDISEREEQHALAIAFNYSTRLVDAMVLKCAIDTGIAKVIHDQQHSRDQGPMTLTQLGASLPEPCTNLDVLRRIMRYLVHMQLFTIENKADDDDGKEEKEESYRMSLAAKFLLVDEEKSIAPLFKLQMVRPCLEAWHSLGSCMQGKAWTSAFEREHGETIFAYASKHPELNVLFNEAMASGARVVVPALIDGCGDLLRKITSLVDVGGGTGTTLASISKAFPHIKCTVLDLPHVVEAAPHYPTVEFVAGDMFSFIPKADAVMLTWILHNWSDEDCVKILKRCKDAVDDGEHGKVIIVDIVIGLDDDPDEFEDVRLATDIIMMTKTGGKERTEKEWKRLLFDAGFSGWKITPIKALQSVIEACP